jgi:ABC-type Zn2+ transport system substrate-binding protein/surface adhesin
LEETEILQQGRGMLKQRSSKEELEVHFQERTQDLHTWYKEMPNKQVEATLHGRITEIEKLEARDMTGSKSRPNSVTV